MLDDFKTTETMESHSGVQEGAVDLPEESQTDSYDEAALDGQDGFVDHQEDGDAEGDDAGEGTPEHDDGDSDGADQNAVQTQTREDNAAIRAARLRARREAEAEAAARADEEIASSGVINPYTGKPFASMKEFREYGEKVKQAEIAERAKKTGKTVEELTEEEKNREFISKMRRQEEQRQLAQAAESEQRAFVEKDVLDFVTKYPEFASPEKLEGLEKNQNFREFCGTRYGKEPLAQLYGAYVKLVGAAGSAATASAASKAARSTGGGTTGGMVLTPSQKRDLDNWNAANPDMKMTAKEFLTR